MTEKSSQMPLPVVPLVIAGVVVLLGCLMIGGVILAAVSRTGGGAQSAQNTPAATARQVIIFTPTPVPTHTPTITPTSVPSATPTETVQPTKPFVPVTKAPATAVPPTAPPADTAVPATAVPIGRGWITDIRFEMPSTSVQANSHIVFNFYIFNARGFGWDFGCIGVKVTDINGVFIKNQWSLGNSSLVHMSFNQGLSWSDSVKNISSPGTFIFSLWMRYDQNLCDAAGGDWENLTPGGTQVLVH